VISLDAEAESECIAFLLNSQCLLQPHHQHWRPIEQLRDLGVFRVLIVLMNTCSEWHSTGRSEVLKMVLDLLHLATVSPKVQLDMCESISIRGVSVQGIG